MKGMLCKGIEYVIGQSLQAVWGEWRLGAEEERQETHPGPSSTRCCLHCPLVLRKPFKYMALYDSPTMTHNGNLSQLKRWFGLRSSQICPQFFYVTPVLF